MSDNMDLLTDTCDAHANATVEFKHGDVCPLCQANNTVELLEVQLQKERALATVTVTVGEGLFAPVQFHSFRHGPFTLEGRVRPDETPEEAMERLYKAAVAVARKTFPQARDLFWDNYEERFQPDKRG
jgi:hypothetical protein